MKLLTKTIRLKIYRKALKRIKDPNCYYKAFCYHLRQNAIECTKHLQNPIEDTFSIDIERDFPEIYAHKPKKCWTSIWWFNPFENAERIAILKKVIYELKPPSQKKRRFKRGDIVRVLTGHPIAHLNKNKKWEAIDISPEDIGRKAIIEGSYHDFYGGEKHDDYAIRFMNNGQYLAWKRSGNNTKT